MHEYRIREKIEENVKKAVAEFQERDDISSRFGEPVIGYVDARDPIFDMYLYKGLSQHPKKIYRPGNTVVLHFVPFAEEIVQSNKGDGAPSEEWSRAFIESMWLSMRLNGVIRETLDTVGRLSSCTNTPADWNEKTCHEEWSHKMAAYAAGMGHFGPAGSFLTKEGRMGRVSAIITDGSYADAPRALSKEEGEAIYAEIMRQCRYEGVQGVSCGEALIAGCPAGAISPEGIDRRKCQTYCKTIDARIPSPDVCGKCFGLADGQIKS